MPLPKDWHERQHSAYPYSHFEPDRTAIGHYFYSEPVGIIERSAKIVAVLIALVIWSVQGFLWYEAVLAVMSKLGVHEMYVAVTAVLVATFVIWLFLMLCRAIDWLLGSGSMWAPICFIAGSIAIVASLIVEFLL